MVEEMFVVASFIEAWRYMVTVCGNKQWCKILAQRPVIKIFQYTNNRTFYQTTHYAYFFVQYIFRFFKS